MGNLFRTALAAGVDAIFLAGGAHPLGQKVLRASSGAVLHLPFLRFDGTLEIALSTPYDLLINSCLAVYNSS